MALALAMVCAFASCTRTKADVADFQPSLEPFEYCGYEATLPKTMSFDEISSVPGREGGHFCHWVSFDDRKFIAFGVMSAEPAPLWDQLEGTAAPADKTCRLAEIKSVAVEVKPHVFASPEQFARECIYTQELSNFSRFLELRPELAGMRQLCFEASASRPYLSADSASLHGFGSTLAQRYAIPVRYVRAPPGKLMLWFDPDERAWGGDLEKHIVLAGEKEGYSVKPLICDAI